jgi:hypothetical protein
VFENAFGGQFRRIVLSFSFLGVFLLQACSTPTRLEPQPAPLTAKVIVIDTPNARFYPDEQVTELYEEGIRSIQREMKALNITDLTAVRLTERFWL